MGRYKTRNNNDLRHVIELRDIYVGIFIIELGSIIRFIQLNRHVIDVVTINSLIDIYTAMLNRCILPPKTYGHIPSKTILRRLKRVRRSTGDDRITELMSIRELVAKEQKK